MSCSEKIHTYESCVGLARPIVPLPPRSNRELAHAALLQAIQRRCAEPPLFTDHRSIEPPPDPAVARRRRCLDLVRRWVAWSAPERVRLAGECERFLIHGVSPIGAGLPSHWPQAQFPGEERRLALLEEAFHDGGPDEAVRDARLMEAFLTGGLFLVDAVRLLEAIPDPADPDPAPAVTESEPSAPDPGPGGRTPIADQPIVTEPGRDLGW